MAVHEIQSQLAKLFATEVSPDVVSRVTDAVPDEVREWQNRPRERSIPWFASRRCGIRGEGLV
jgi:putative transposase